jgi:hypothetical protein
MNFIAAGVYGEAKEFRLMGEAKIYPYKVDGRDPSSQSFLPAASMYEVSCDGARLLLYKRASGRQHDPMFFVMPPAMRRNLEQRINLARIALVRLCATSN